MKVLLLQDVKGLGKKMAVKEVKDGFARNYLMPKNLAVPVTRENLQAKSRWEKHEQELVNRYQDLVNKLANTTLDFTVAVGKKGETFGSVKSEDIKAALKEKGFEEGEVLMERPFKKLGEHIVEINFGRGVKGAVKVILKPGSRNSIII